MRPIAVLRKTAGMTQRAFADKFGVTQTMLARLEAGKVEPSKSLCRRLEALAKRQADGDRWRGDHYTCGEYITNGGTFKLDRIEYVYALWQCGIEEAELQRIEGVQKCPACGFCRKEHPGKACNVEDLLWRE